MSRGLAPRLPLTIDDHYGYSLLEDMVDVVRSNFKNLLLTNPGERMMVTDFGVGLQRYLFEVNSEPTYGNLRAAISSQVEKYMPYLTINDVQVRAGDDNSPHKMTVTVLYTVDSLGFSDALQVSTKQATFTSFTPSTNCGSSTGNWPGQNFMNPEFGARGQGA